MAAIYQVVCMFGSKLMHDSIIEIVSNLPLTPFCRVTPLILIEPLPTTVLELERDVWSNISQRNGV